MKGFRRNTGEFQNLQSNFKKHLTQVREERHQQEMRDQTAAQYPTESWTITTDFMQDLFMPYLAYRPKSWYFFRFE